MRNVELDDCADDSHQASHQVKSYRRIELITGDRRRRRWTVEEKAEILAESFRPGASVTEVARRRGMSRGLLWTWRHQARKRGAVGEPSFVPMRIVEETTVPPGQVVVDREEGAELAPTGQPADCKAKSITGTIDIEIRGARVRVNGMVDAAALRQVLSYLGGRS
jgi:transposase